MFEAISVIKEMLKKYLEGIHPVAWDKSLPTPAMLEKEVQRYE